MRTRHNTFVSPPLPARQGSTNHTGVANPEPSEPLPNSNPAHSKQNSAAQSNQDQTQDHESPKSMQPHTPPPLKSASGAAVSPVPLAQPPSYAQKVLFLPAPRFSNPSASLNIAGSPPSPPCSTGTPPDSIFSDSNWLVKGPKPLQPANQAQARDKANASGDASTTQGRSLPYEAVPTVAEGDSCELASGGVEGAHAEAAKQQNPRLSRPCGNPDARSCLNDRCAEHRAQGLAGGRAHLRAVRQRHNLAAGAGLEAVAACVRGSDGAEIASAAAAAAAATGARQPPVRRKEAGAASRSPPTRATPGLECPEGAAVVQLHQGSLPDPHGCKGRRVSFAEGPLKAVHGTADGHPPHEGHQFAAPVPGPSKCWSLSLGAAHMAALAEELGLENGPSVERLKRRLGLLPPIRRPRIYINARPVQETGQHAGVPQSLLDRLLGGIPVTGRYTAMPPQHAGPTAVCPTNAYSAVCGAAKASGAKRGDGTAGLPKLLTNGCESGTISRPSPIGSPVRRLSPKKRARSVEQGAMGAGSAVISGPGDSGATVEP